MAEAARREDEPDRETLEQLVVSVHRTAHQMLYKQRLARCLLMSDIALIHASVQYQRMARRRLSGGAGGVGGGGEPPDSGPEGAD